MSNILTHTIYRATNNLLHRYGVKKWEGLKDCERRLKFGSSLLLSSKVHEISPQIKESQLSDHQKVLAMLEVIEKDLRSSSYSSKYGELVSAFKRSFQRTGEVRDKLSLHSPNEDPRVTMHTLFNSHAVGTPPKAKLVFQDAHLSVRKSMVDTSWNYINDPIVRTAATAFFIKEGTYIALCENQREKLTAILETETDFMNNLKRAESFKKYPGQIVVDYGLIKSAKRFLASDVHLEFLGYKEMYEYLYDSGFNAFTYHYIEQNRINPNDETLSGLLLIAKNGIPFINKRGEFNEGRFKDYLIEDMVSDLAALNLATPRRLALELVLADREIQRSQKSNLCFIADELQKVKF